MLSLYSGLPSSRGRDEIDQEVANSSPNFLSKIGNLVYPYAYRKSQAKNDSPGSSSDVAA